MKYFNKVAKGFIVLVFILGGLFAGSLINVNYAQSSSSPCGTCDYSSSGVPGGFCNFNYTGPCGGNNGGPCGSVPCPGHDDE